MLYKMRQPFISWGIVTAAHIDAQSQIVHLGSGTAYVCTLRPLSSRSNNWLSIIACECIGSKESG